MSLGVIIVPYMTGYGGTETVIKNLFIARKKEKQPFELKVLSIGGSSDYNWAKNVDIDIKWISKKRIIRDLYALVIMPFLIFNYLKREKPDFVIPTNPVIWFLAKQCLRLLNKKTPVIAWYHYSIDQKSIKRIFLNSADYYLAISSGIVQQLVNRGIKRKKIFLIFNPVTSDYHLIKRSKNIHFIYLGRIMLDGQKNLRELIDALADIKGNWKLDLYGNDKYTQDVKNYIKQKGIISHVKFHGFMVDPWNKIKSATALLLTSEYEGLPMVLCEAISHGIYCVSANTSTGPEDILNNKNGEIYTLGDEKSLTNILQKIVDGKVLPDQNLIQETANKFIPTQYLNSFNNAIISIINHK